MAAAGRRRHAPGFCVVADGGCVAPCAFRVGNGIGSGTRKVRTKCGHCGEHVCRVCSKGAGKRRRCNNCIEDERRFKR